MLRRFSVFAALCLGFVLHGCKDKPAPQGATVAPDTPPPPPSATAIAPAPSASVTAPAPGQGHRFIVRRKVPNQSLQPIWFLGAGIVACQDLSCREDAFLITEEGSTESYNPLAVMRVKEPKLFPKESVAGVIYHGDYPNICAITVFPDDRTGTGGSSIKRTGKTWVLGECPRRDGNSREETIPRPPREFDDALLHAPMAGAAKTLVYGAGAPAMVIEQQVLYVWDGKTWSKREAPWTKNQRELKNHLLHESRRPVRLANGMTIVPEGGFLIDTKGEVSPLQLVHDDKPISKDAEIVGALWAPKFPWLLGYDGTDIYLSTPDKNENIAYEKASLVGRPPAAKPAPAATIASPQASPSASAGTPEPSPSASAAAPAFPSSSLGNPRAFTAECKTPFVVLASPPKPGQAYATTREGLRGHGELQDIVTFVEIVIAGKTIFGVQTRNEADARQFMEVVEKSVKGMKPALQCLDVLSLVPDRYAPPEGIRLVGINLTTGELVPFD